MKTTELPKQFEIGWVCPACHLVRGPDRLDPCLGILPGVNFACCGHGGHSIVDPYISFTNGVVIRWPRGTHITVER